MWEKLFIERKARRWSIYSKTSLQMSEAKGVKESLGPDATFQCHPENWSWHRGHQRLIRLLPTAVLAGRGGGTLASASLALQTSAQGSCGWGRRGMFSTTCPLWLHSPDHIIPSRAGVRKFSFSLEISEKTLIFSYKGSEGSPKLEALNRSENDQFRLGKNAWGKSSFLEMDTSTLHLT